MNRYVDRIGFWAHLWVFGILGLSLVDAALTLSHLQRGGDELVPTMRWALGRGVEVFLLLKMGLTTLGATCLAIHRNYRLAHRSMWLVMSAYCLLLAYHFFLLVLHQ